MEPSPAFREQVARLLASDLLRTSESQRRLLRYLADKSLDGTADQLKEYTVGSRAWANPTPTTPARTLRSASRPASCARRSRSTTARRGPPTRSASSFPKGTSGWCSGPKPPPWLPLSPRSRRFAGRSSCSGCCWRWRWRPCCSRRSGCARRKARRPPPAPGGRPKLRRSGSRSSMFRVPSWFAWAHRCLWSFPIAACTGRRR